MPGAGLSIRKA